MQLQACVGRAADGLGLRRIRGAHQHQETGPPERRDQLADAVLVVCLATSLPRDYPAAHIETSLGLGFRLAGRVVLVTLTLGAFCQRFRWDSRAASASRMAKRMTAVAPSSPVTFWSFSRTSRSSSVKRIVVGRRSLFMLTETVAVPFTLPVKRLARGHAEIGS